MVQLITYDIQNNTWHVGKYFLMGTAFLIRRVEKNPSTVVVTCSQCNRIYQPANVMEECPGCGHYEDGLFC